MNRLLVLLQLATTLPLAGLIWTIQVVHYPLFAGVGPERFAAYHADHSRLISLLVVPLMCVELLSEPAPIWWTPQNARRCARSCSHGTSQATTVHPGFQG